MSVKNTSNTPPLARNKLVQSIALACLVTVPGAAYSKGEVTTVTTSVSPATTSTYSGLNWGHANDLNITGFSTSPTDAYTYSSEADLVVVRRTSSVDSCSVFADTTGFTGNYNATFPDGGTASGICDMASLMSGTIINVGALDVFSNAGDNIKNIERIDFITTTGLPTPLSSTLIDKTGHVVIEKGGNNPIQVAAIKSIDGSNTPTSFGPLLTVHPSGCTTATETCYGTLSNAANKDYLHTATGSANSLLVTSPHASGEGLGIAFVSLSELGLVPGETYYGFSYFATDVTVTTPAELVDYTDPTHFPTTTHSGAAGNADIYGGSAGYFQLNTIRKVSGKAFNDTNRDGSQTGVEADLPNISINIYEDTNSNNAFDSGTDTLLGSTTTSSTGDYTLSGLIAGTYFIQADEADTDLPTGLSLPTNPIQVSITTADITNQNFAFRPAASTGTPVASNDSASTSEGQFVDISVTGNDTDPNSTGLTVTITTPPTNGTAVVSGTSVRYTPNAGFTGSDSFIYQIEDGLSSTSSATVNIAVGPDSDGDGIADSDDLDDDNDGILDTVETTNDFDGDGIPNSLDLDSDNDGIPDVSESGLVTTLAVTSGRIASSDFGSNGLANEIETSTESGIPNYNATQGATPLDTDKDGAPNFLDLDSDADNLTDLVEAFGTTVTDADSNGKVDGPTGSAVNGWDTTAGAAFASGLPNSDQNTNGIADYLECGCSTLPIDTGLQGNGVGSFGSLLLPLAGLTLLRRKLFSIVKGDK